MEFLNIIEDKKTFEEKDNNKIKIPRELNENE